MQRSACHPHEVMRDVARFCPASPLPSPPPSPFRTPPKQVLTASKVEETHDDGGREQKHAESRRILDFYARHLGILESHAPDADRLNVRVYLPHNETGHVYKLFWFDAPWNREGKAVDASTATSSAFDAEIEWTGKFGADFAVPVEEQERRRLRIEDAWYKVGMIKTPVGEKLRTNGDVVGEVEKLLHCIHGANLYHGDAHLGNFVRLDGKVRAIDLELAGNMESAPDEMKAQYRMEDMNSLHESASGLPSRR